MKIIKKKLTKQSSYCNPKSNIYHRSTRIIASHTTCTSLHLARMRVATSAREDWRCAGAGRALL